MPCPASSLRKTRPRVCLDTAGCVSALRLTVLSFAVCNAVTYSRLKSENSLRSDLCEIGRKGVFRMPGRMELTDDDDLAQRLLENDQGCLDDILRSFGAGILGLLRRRFRDVLREEDLEDVLSMGLFRLWTSRNRYQMNLASLRVWWYRICENAARDVLRMGWQKARAREVHSDAAFVGISEQLSRSDFDSECVSHAVSTPTAMHLDLKDVLSELPEVQRAILLADAAARDAVACSQRLGDDLGLPASTVRVYRKRAMDRVRRELIARGHGPEDTKHL